MASFAEHMANFLFDDGLGGDDTDATAGTVATEALSLQSDEVNHGVISVISEVESDTPTVDTSLFDDVSTTDERSSTSSHNSSSVSQEEYVAAAPAEGNSTISSMSMDDLSSLTTTTSLDELEDSDVEEAQNINPSERQEAEVGTPSEEITTGTSSSGDVSGGGVIGGERWRRIRMPSAINNTQDHGAGDNLDSHEAESGAQTILSSINTDDIADDRSSADAEENSDALVLSFQPSMIDSSAYDMPSSFRENQSETSQSDVDSVQSSSSTQTDYAKSPPWPSEETGLDPSSFAAVGRSLLLSSDSNENNEHGNNDSNATNWWQPLSEKDWERMYHEAKSVLDSLEDDDNTVIPPPLPPSIPEVGMVPHDHVLEDETRSSAIKCLPPEFICSCCENVMTGAIVLGCGCERSTYCMRCIEDERRPRKFGSYDACPASTTPRSEDDEDYVMVEKPFPARPPSPLYSSLHSKPQSVCDTALASPIKTPSSNTKHNRAMCPSCNKADALIVPCVALDAAILNAVCALSTSSRPNLSRDDVQAFQSEYYYRLQRWREDVLSRRKLLGEESDRKRQELLALLIQAEEEMIWKKRKQRRRGLFGLCKEERRQGFGQVAFAVGAVAMAAIIGIKLIRRC